jgi:hypothetical protein
MPAPHTLIMEAKHSSAMSIKFYQTSGFIPQKTAMTNILNIFNFVSVLWNGVAYKPN